MNSKKHPITALIPSVLLLINCGGKQPPSAALVQQQIDKLVFVEGGTFQMGDAGYTGSSNNTPAHSVTLSSYSIQAYETTYREFDAYTNAIGDELVGQDYRKKIYMQPPYPAKWMTWYQARGYCHWRGKKITRFFVCQHEKLTGQA